MAHKTSRQLERHLKGLANNWRLDILMFVAKQPGVTTDQISGAINCHFKTTSMHTIKLVQAGLLEKKYMGQKVLHSLSSYGKIFYKFLQAF